MTMAVASETSQECVNELSNPSKLCCRESGEHVACFNLKLRSVVDFY